MSSRAVVLLSGGLDSAVTLAVAKRECTDVFALTVRYGQRHAIEAECAVRVARALGVAEHRVLDVDLASWGGSSLTYDGPVPKGEAGTEGSGEIPSTYVPARNTVLLSLALSWAEVLGAEAIYIGAHTQDAGGYPDTRPEYLAAFERMANLATRAGVEGRGQSIRAPLLRMGKGEVVALGRSLGIDFALTSSCYDPTPAGAPCGRCSACLLRARGFVDAGLPDPRVADDR
jgi:7-cyano-7-deazaguanine synthase